MAIPIYICTKDLLISDAKKASSCIGNAISSMNKVEDAVSGWDLYIDAVADGFVFAKSEAEIGVCLSALRSKQSQLESLISILQTGTDKLEETDAAFKNEITDPSLWDRLTAAVSRVVYSSTFGKVDAALAGIAWLSSLFRDSKIEGNREKNITIDAADEYDYQNQPVVEVIINENPDYTHQWHGDYIIPPKVNKEGSRDAEAYREVMAALDVENNQRYAEAYNPYWGFSSTMCNVYVFDVLVAMDCPIPIKAFGCGDMRDWMASEEGKAAGWSEVDQETAIEMANKGYPTVATDIRGSHVAMVAPQYDGDTGCYLSQAGGNNFEYGSINMGWGKSYDLKTEIRYFYHK